MSPKLPPGAPAARPVSADRRESEHFARSRSRPAIGGARCDDQAFGIKVRCWPPNDDAHLALVLDRSADAVMTDRVGTLTTLLDARGPYQDRKPAFRL